MYYGLEQYLDQDLTGDLDFILTTEERILYDKGNMAIPSQLVFKLYSLAWDQFSSGKETVNSSKVICIVNPEVFTAWNHRRKLCLEEKLDPNQEYQFTTFLISKHPKKSRIWDYRLWLDSKFQITEEIKRDIEICFKAADRYRCNYPAWGFMRSKYCFNLYSVASILPVLEESKKFIKSHISDYSAWSFRQGLYFRIHQLDSSFDIEAEVEWTKEKLKFYGDHEVLWLHLRFLCELYGKHLDNILNFANSQQDSNIHSLRLINYLISDLEDFPTIK